jgi:hypothetical protein
VPCALTKTAGLTIILRVKDGVKNRASAGETIIRQPTEQAFMKSQDNSARAYVLVEIQPGKEKEFADEVLSKGLILDSKVERMDFVHGPFDFVVILKGAMRDIDVRVLEMRKSPFVRKTETLICHEIFAWEDLSGRLNE